MQRTLAGLQGVAVLLAVGPRAVHGHHSFAAEFDANNPFAVTGVVSRLEWMNPHAYVYLDVADGTNGEVSTWAMEMGSPNALQRAGWTRNSMRVGDVVAVEGSFAKDGSRTGNARAVTLAETGQRLFTASSQSRSREVSGRPAGLRRASCVPPVSAWF